MKKSFLNKIKHAHRVLCAVMVLMLLASTVFLMGSSGGAEVKNGDFEKQAVQKSLLEPEINAGNPVKPIGDFQLPMEQPTRDKEKSKRQIVRRANINVKSFFMRDLYGKVTKADWFGQP